jgi:aldose 1-epimerase
MQTVPTGELAAVANTPFDFTKGKQIGRDVNQKDDQLYYGLGYDHNWVLNQKEDKEVILAAELWEETTGRVMEIYTDEPGIQFYCGNFMDGSYTGKSGKKYVYRSGVALETQHFPNSPNEPEFPSTILKPGEKYTQLCIYKFGTLEK